MQNQSKYQLKYLSRELRLNEYYLSHLISEHLHMNFREYLNSIRIDYAVQMMQSTRLSLTHIWADAGFESQTTFNRAFQRTMHVTPSQYRKSLRSSSDSFSSISSI